jgi:hypothetical protein
MTKGKYCSGSASNTLVLDFRKPKKKKKKKKSQIKSDQRSRLSFGWD